MTRLFLIFAVPCAVFLYSSGLKAPLYLDDPNVLAAARLGPIDLTGPDGQKTGVKAADLTNADLEDADLYRTDLTQAVLDGAKLAGTVLDKGGSAPAKAAASPAEPPAPAEPLGRALARPWRWAAGRPTRLPGRG